MCLQSLRGFINRKKIDFERLGLTGVLDTVQNSNEERPCVRGQTLNDMFAQHVHVDFERGYDCGHSSSALLLGHLDPVRYHFGAIQDLTDYVFDFDCRHVFASPAKGVAQSIAKVDVAVVVLSVEALSVVVAVVVAAIVIVVSESIMQCIIGLVVVNVLAVCRSSHQHMQSVSLLFVTAMFTVEVRQDAKHGHVVVHMKQQ
jgi:hypothetical protein